MKEALCLITIFLVSFLMLIVVFLFSLYPESAGFNIHKSRPLYEIELCKNRNGMFVFKGWVYSEKSVKDTFNTSIYLISPQKTFKTKTFFLQTKRSENYFLTNGIKNNTSWRAGMLSITPSIFIEPGIYRVGIEYTNNGKNYSTLTTCEVTI